MRILGLVVLCTLYVLDGQDVRTVEKEGWGVSHSVCAK